MASVGSRLVDASFPSELILDAVEHLAFGNGTIISTLLQVHPRIRLLLKIYQLSITKGFVRRELPHAPTDFPRDEEKQGYAWLSECVKKYDVVDDVMAILISNLNCFAVEKHNMAVVNTGMLLLHHLQSFDSYAAQLSYIKALPRDPLTAMYLAIHHATLTARYHGSGIIHQRIYGRFMDANALSLRSDVEFCFAEGILQLGPSFIHSTLLGSENDESTLLNLYHDHATHDWFLESVMEGVWQGDGADLAEVKPPVTQGPHRDPAKKERSLWTTLLERLADLASCPLEEVKGRIEDDVEPPDHSLAWLDLAGKARLMEGKDLDYIDG